MEVNELGMAVMEGSDAARVEETSEEYCAQSTAHLGSQLVLGEILPWGNVALPGPWAPEWASLHGGLRPWISTVVLGADDR